MADRNQVYTVVINHATGGEQLGAGITVNYEVEFEAEEDMYLIGAILAGTKAVKCDVICTLIKGALSHYMSAYGTSQLFTGDRPMFSAHLTASAVEGDIGHTNEFQMLPKGEYFFIEEGEGFSMNGQLRNNDVAIHTLLAQAIVFYKKTKPKP